MGQPDKTPPKTNDIPGHQCHQYDTLDFDDDKNAIVNGVKHTRDTKNTFPQLDTLDNVIENHRTNSNWYLDPNKDCVLVGEHGVSRGRTWQLRDGDAGRQLVEYKPRRSDGDCR